jgi:hypothetical protein
VACACDSAAILTNSKYGLFVAAFTGLGTVVACIPLLHFWYQWAVPRYQMSVAEAQEFRIEIANLQQKFLAVQSRYSRRRKGQQFKNAYDLCGKRLSSLEESLGVGMRLEKKEVFVTAFMKEGVAVRVTAAIGSARRCAPADDPSQWRMHVQRLNCDEIRQYHSHPVYAGKTEPSQPDYNTHQVLRTLLREHEEKLRSFIVYWNEVGEWRILEYNDRGYCTHFEFDVSNSSAGDLPTSPV